MTWHEAYLLQARSDWQIFRMLQQQPVPECHPLHYLQMATEKLGKACIIAGGNAPAQVRTSHKAFVRFLQIAAYNPDLQKQLRMTGVQLRAHIKALLPVAEEIEKLAPAIAHSGPNAEYPWETPVGTVHVPATYSFTVSSQLRTPKGIKLLNLILVILEHAYKFVP